MVVVFGVLDRPSCERQGAPFSQNQFRTTVNPSTSPDPVRLPTAVQSSCRVICLRMRSSVASISVLKTRIFLRISFNALSTQNSLLENQYRGKT